MKIALCTGGFDPIHSGHIAYLKQARLMADMLIVGLNSDEWLERKKGRAFMPWNERLCILNNLGMVSEVYTFDDEDGSARHFIQQVRAHYPDAELIFANGGDRTKENIPEMDFDDKNLYFAFGIGGENKANSSSWILEEWKAPKTPRPWGYYRVLHEVPGTKVKELTVDPGQSLSMQKHQFRWEYWHVAQGKCVVQTINSADLYESPKILEPLMHFQVQANQWHQLINPFQEPCKIIEIQYGSSCEENDIERR